MSRIQRHIANDLIKYVKNIELQATYWDPKSMSALEFSRQMLSARLKKLNPVYECSLTYRDSDEPPKINVEYIDGSKWSSSTADVTAAVLRAELYDRASRVEEKMEAAGTVPNFDLLAGGGAKKDGKAPGGGKPGKK
jgi:hypothetical protein